MTNNKAYMNTYVAPNQQLVCSANPLTASRTTFKHFFHVKNTYVGISDDADIWTPFTGMGNKSIVIARPIHHQLSGMLVRLPDFEGCSLVLNFPSDRSPFFSLISM